ncbi:hypothetical protein BBJ28_00021764 [Nothophytophthora sp. Chile5]|nr:hypothetical protein BBJ28_00021764 [Nothophytophthora sp. Chile5]
MQRARSPSDSSLRDEKLEGSEDAPVAILPKEIRLAEDAGFCYVKLTSQECEYKTSVMTKTREPRWHEVFVFRAVDWTTGVTVSVRDRLPLKMHFLGQVVISSAEVASLPGMATQRWFQLRDKGPVGAPSGAELELKVALVYTKAYDSSVLSSGSAAMELQYGVTGVGEAGGALVDQEDETEEEFSARAKAARRREEQEREAAAAIAGLKQGDYQVQVHIIEARDLKGENLSGTSDPYCQVEVLGVTRKTSTKYDTLGCVFDEILFFHFADIGRHELREASIKVHTRSSAPLDCKGLMDGLDYCQIAVYDKEKVLKDNLIGIYQLDCLSVYGQVRTIAILQPFCSPPHHELYRQWIAVHDHLNTKDRGIQGFLLVSVVVLGPGDPLPVHDRDLEFEQELEQTADHAVEGAQVTPLLLVPPTIELKLQFLVVKVLRAEHLPAMDSGGIVTARGIDAYVQVAFSANAACRSSCVTVKGHGDLAPEFFEELWLPVRTPTFSRHIALSVWDRDLTSPNELVGVASHDFQQVPAVSNWTQGSQTSRQATESPRGVGLMLGDSDEEREREESGGLETENDETSIRERQEYEEEQQQLVAAAPRWYNLYGPPLRGTNTKRAQLVARQAELGSTYRGRVLLSIVRMESPRPEDGEKMHSKPMAAVERELSERSTPKTVKYVLRGALYCGVEIPRGTAASSFSRSSQVRVTLSIGSYTLAFDSQELAKDGTVTWEQCVEPPTSLELPADLTQVPDVIVTLSRSISSEDFVSVSYARFRAEDLFARGFTAKCQWVVLKEELTRRQTRFALERSQSPGVLLLRLGFGRVEMAARHRWVSGDDSDELFAPFRSPRVYREIRVHVFQARGLESPANVTRNPNPVVRVNCCGQRKLTTARPGTSSPLFYESLVFSTNVSAADLVFTPDLLLQVLDSSGSNAEAGDGGATGVLGELRLPLSIAVRSVPSAGSPKPQWHDLKRSRQSLSTSASLAMAGQTNAGQLLVAVQYIDHPGSVPPPLLSPPASIAPKYTTVTLEIVALGLRRLKAFSTLGVRRPYVEFELVGGYFVDGLSVRRTQPGVSGALAVSGLGASGSNTDANFLERIVADVKLPLDTLYAPQLQIRVCDSSLGGLRKTTLASSVVDLATKLPWSSSYVNEALGGGESAFENPTQRSVISRTEHDAEDLATGKKASVLRRESRVGLDDEDFALDEELEEGQPEAETESHVDDGVGVGDLLLPTNYQSHARLGHNQTDDKDPAMMEQRRREEERRYHAGKSALLFAHRGVKDRRVSILGSPRSSSRDQELHRAPYLRGRDWWISQFGGEELEQYFTRPALETYPLTRPALSRPSLLHRQRVRVQLDAGVFKGRITITEQMDAKGSKSPKGGSQGQLELQRLQGAPQPVVVRLYVLRGRNLQAKNANGFSDPYLRLKLGGSRLNDRAHGCTNTLQPEFFRTFELETTLPGASHLEIAVWDRGLVSDELIGATTIDLEDRWFHREWQQIGEGHPSHGKAAGGLKPIEYRHLYVPHSRSTSQGFLQLWVDILTAQEAARVSPVDISPPEPKAFEVRVVVWRAENVQDQVQSEINDYFVKAWMEGGGVSGSSRAESTDTHWRCSNGKPCWNWRLKLRTEFPPRSPELARLHLQLWDKDVLKWNDVLGEAQLDLYKWLRRAYDTNRTVEPFLELKRLAKQSAPSVSGVGEPSRDYEEISGDGSSSEDDTEEGHVTVTVEPHESNSLLSPSPTKAAPNTRKYLKLKRKQGPTAAEQRLTKARKDQAKAKAALDGLLDLMGLGKLPDDAEWIPIHYTDRESAVSMEMGRVGISVQIVPEEEALASPVGKGQNALNLNPYLPPPMGRMRLSANPLAMLKELVGPKMCLRLSLLCCCGGCLLFVSVFGATVMSTLTYLQAVEASHKGSRP